MDQDKLNFQESYQLILKNKDYQNYFINQHDFNKRIYLESYSDARSNSSSKIYSSYAYTDRISESVSDYIYENDKEI